MYVVHNDQEHINLLKFCILQAHVTCIHTGSTPDHIWDWKSMFYVRQPGEYQCNTLSYRKPSLGTDILGSSWNPFVDNHQGLPMFEISMQPSIDCSRFVPDGFFSTNTKLSHMSMQQDISSSSQKLSERSSEAVKVGVSASTGQADFSVSASIETGFRGNTEKKQSQKFISTSIEAVEDVFTIRKTRPPVFVSDFKRLIDYAAVAASSPDQGDSFLNLLLQRYPGYIAKLVTGESYTQVHMCKLCLL